MQREGESSAALEPKSCIQMSFGLESVAEINCTDLDKVLGN